jgi:predicted transcriptional regulator
MAPRKPSKPDVAAAAGSELPAAELDVLSFLWRRGPATAGEIRDGIASFRPMAHGSVVTLLKRLEEKKLVAPVDKRGKAFVYEATRTPEPTYRRLVGDLLERVFGGNAVSLVSSLFAGRPPTGEELIQLRKLLNELTDSQKER